jgi:hypothetical protein
MSGVYASQPFPAGGTSHSSRTGESRLLSCIDAIPLRVGYRRSR